MQTNPSIGILGGGQLGRMMQEAALPLNIRLRFLDPSPDAPCSAFADQLQVGNWKDASTVAEFGQGCSALGIEFEDVSAEGIDQLEQAGISCIPASNLLQLIQDKSEQKKFLQRSGIPTLPFQVIHSVHEIQEYPCILKKAKGGYDGYGVKKIESALEFPTQWSGPFVVEPLCRIKKEISVLVARNSEAELAVWEPAEMVFNAQTHMVERIISPGELTLEQRQQAIQLGKDCALALKSTGILAVEMFLTEDDTWLVNEMAPRPHNSGHWTIEGSATSQFEQYVRILSGLPLGSTESTGYSATLNLLGAEDAEGTADEATARQQLSGFPFIQLHLYGKKQVKPHRKMGHITVVAKTAQELHEHLSKIPPNFLRIPSLSSKP